MNYRMLTDKSHVYRFFKTFLKLQIHFHVIQCPKFKFCFVHLRGALLLELCTRDFLHVPSQYGLMTNSSENVHTPCAHLRKSCTRPRNCARRVQGAPLISDTNVICNDFLLIIKTNRIWPLFESILSFCDSDWGGGQMYIKYIF